MVPFEIGDFDENGKFGQNCEMAPSKVAILTIMANLTNMAKIRQSIIFKANEMAKGPLEKAILTKMTNLAKIRLCDFLQIRHCENFWT